MHLAMSEATMTAIRRHAARIYPNECCGALLGPATGQVEEAYVLDNTFPDTQRRRFLVGPEEYRRAEARATETGLMLLGFYHSHPDHPGEPSQFDLDHAWPNMSYLIISVRQGQPKEARSWRLKADRSGCWVLAYFPSLNFSSFIFEPWRGAAGRSISPDAVWPRAWP